MFEYNFVPAGEQMQESMFSDLQAFFRTITHGVEEEIQTQGDDSDLQMGLQFTAALLNRLERVEDRSARFIISAENRGAALMVMELRLQQYLLMNNLHEAAILSDELTRFFPGGGFLLRAAEIYMALGDTSSARSRLQTYLQQSSPGGEDYDRSSYLLSRVLIDEGSSDRAMELLYRTYSARLTQEQRLNRWNRYGIQNLVILRNLLSAEEQADRLSPDQTTFFRRLRSDLRQYDEVNGEKAVPNPGLETFPGPRVLSTAKAHIPQYRDEYLENADNVQLGGQSDLSPAPEKPGASPDLTESTNTPDTQSPSSQFGNDTDSENSGLRDTKVVADPSMPLIQLGVFSRRENASAFSERLEEREYPVFLSYDSTRNLYRVLLDSTDAYFRGSENYGNPRRLLLQLKEEGIEGFVVAE